MKKFLSLALCLALVLSLGVSAFATGGGIYESDGKTHNFPSEEYTIDEIIGGVEASGSGTTVNVGTEDAPCPVSRILSNAVVVKEGATVNIIGSVTVDDLGFGHHSGICLEENANVSVIGDVSADTGIFAYGGECSVEGDVTGTGGSAIYAEGGANIMVGGDVTGNVLDNGAVVIVEGLVTGDIYVNDNSSTEVYIGQLNGKVPANLYKVHYLVGLSDDSDCDFSDISMSGDAIIDPQKTIDGVEKSYLYTTTASPTNKVVTIKPADGKILTVSGFDGAKVNYVPNDDGTVTFTILSGFNGGMQNLRFILADKPVPGPDPDPEYYPVYYVVPAGSVTVVEFKAPEGVEEGLIKALDSADHAGLTVDSSLTGDVAVKVFKGSEELSSNDFSIYTHADGSTDVILSNTYLYALGTGSYDFTAVVNGQEIPFTVAVAI